MHDASALIQLVVEDAFQTIEGSACVAVDGPAMGQLIVDRKARQEYYLPYWRDRSPINVAMQVDGDRVQKIWVDTLIGGFGN
jgi:inosine-uridine nucleoside N-ribohydrolase